jgi:hypothetical protein
MATIRLETICSVARCVNHVIRDVQCTFDAFIVKCAISCLRKFRGTVSVRGENQC